MARCSAQGADRRIYLSFAASRHAEMRIGERTQLSVQTVVERINSGRGIPLNNPNRHFAGRAYFLLYSEQDEKFFVAIAAPAGAGRSERC